MKVRICIWRNSDVCQAILVVRFQPRPMGLYFNAKEKGAIRLMYNFQKLLRKRGRQQGASPTTKQKKMHKNGAIFSLGIK